MQVSYLLSLKIWLICSIFRSSLYIRDIKTLLFKLQIFFLILSLYLAYGIYATQKIVIVINQILSQKSFRKVYPPQVIEKFIHVFFWYLYGFYFTFKYLTHLKFITMHVMNNWFKHLFIAVPKQLTNSSFHHWFDMLPISFSTILYRIGSISEFFSSVLLVWLSSHAAPF